MNNSPAIQGRLGSLIVTAFFFIAGIVTLYDTTSYSDTDSQVFPQTVAIGLILFTSISLITQFLKPSESEGFGSGIWWRRALLIVTMLLACAIMPYGGFLPAGAIAFAGGLIAAMHDHWSFRTVLVYWGSGIVVMVAFFTLFKFALQVPLP
jgi:putative tricarboxylic transport membrane protein